MPRSRLPGAVSCTLLLASTVPALAQQPYPFRPVRIVSPFAAGGGNDAICRILSPRLPENLK
jgi:tripartite-type tricarboxylate transporter receptor subunit TctC